MTASQPPFAYHSLHEETHEIRLLQLLPRADEKEGENVVGEIHCELLRVEYLESPSDQAIDSQHGWGTFAALSYVWGSSTLPKRHIYISGVKFEVTLNLHNALTRLLRFMREDEKFPRRIWVDAVCIDQSNFDERNKQVLRMRYIYGAASVVVCALPPEWCLTDTGEARARVMGWDAGVSMLRLLAGAQSDVGREAFAEHLRSGVVQYSAERWASLFNFFANPYWTRLWIIQEIALASRDIMILAGTNSMPWNTVSSVAALFRSLPYTIRETLVASVRASGRAMAPFSSNLDKIVDIQKLVADRVQENKYAQPSTILRLARKAQATNARDKVYGLLSLIDPSLSQPIHVDYRKTAGTVWTEFASVAIEMTGSLQILRHCSQPDHNRARDAPSWAPDLGNGNVALPFGKVRIIQIHIREASDPWIDGKVLNVSGVRLDTIDSVSSVRREFDDLFLNRDTERGIVQSSATTKKATKQYERSIKDLYRELAATFLSGSASSSAFYLNPELPPMGWLKRNKGTSRSVDRVVSFLEQNGELPLPGGYLLRDVLEQFPHSTKGTDGHGEQRKAPSDDEWYLQLVDYIDSILNYRRLAVTTKGHISLVPCDTRPDDHVYALGAYSGLGILRKQNEMWRWVGSCYVHSLAHDDHDPDWSVEEVEHISII
ncbi:hypothetical protein M409DRAFT_27149 [Zasmidium cellare ATCC 36951]|uniref:Heterokaryon incompatibility domain-containing protein n=1 Tax=Zasmidium cellare ATCC 36951 TaxID=1080233 RepID=A0A6A6CAP3_ZASCE|nr:uncharacterized protein M409DRAFT_27149 [Zasmidium cellare ATCC 36951]KAF2162526.1 hypothetical protein M409DRAFT_27149 [Zasmidium cellare ATCC 36951]